MTDTSTQRNAFPVMRPILTAVGAMVLASSASAATSLSMWVHAGPGPERDVYEKAVKVFNDTHPDIQVKLVALPEGKYSDQVNAAALAGKLPCVLDFDGPNVYNYAWSGKIIALDNLPIGKKAKAEMLPTLVRQGTYGGQLYSVAQFDSGLALWGNKAQLTAAGIRIPKGVDDAWTQAEFEDALKKLKASGVAHPLDMKFNYGIGEWLSYGFSPLLQAFGGDLIDRKNYRSAKGVINGPASVQAMTTLQGWVKQGWVNPGTKSDGDFMGGKSALSWVGHWVFKDYKAALGDKLVLLPMPRFAKGAVTGAGSWNFGISKTCNAVPAASALLEFLLSKEQVLGMSEANGAVPATMAAQSASEYYRPGGVLRLYIDQANKGVSRVRPQTPAYPVISTAFAEAVNNIVNGADAQKELDKAAAKIDEDIADNGGYKAK